MIDAKSKIKIITEKKFKTELEMIAELISENNNDLYWKTEDIEFKELFYYDDIFNEWFMIEVLEQYLKLLGYKVGMDYEEDWFEFRIWIKPY